jgi:putative MFS transporter
MGRFLWLPPGARPPIPLPYTQELFFLLVGTTLLFGGYDLNIFGLALPQIQHSLNIPENHAGLTVSYFRLAAIPALLLALSADLFGRRRLLLFTVFGEAVFTILTAFAQDYHQFVWLQVGARVFGYCEEILCFVVIAEEIDAGARGWAVGALGAMGAVGAGLASIAFAAVNILPFGWRSLYVIGGAALLVLSYYRRLLPETARFEQRKKELALFTSRTRAMLDALHGLITEYPARLAAILLAVFAFGFAMGAPTVLMSKYLQHALHYRPGEVTLLFVGGGLVAVAGNILAGRLSDRFGRKKAIFAQVLISGLGFAVFFSGAHGWAVAIAWIFAVMGYLAGGSLLAGYPAELFPTAYRATVGGIRYLAWILSGAVGLALEGLFYDRFHAHGPAIMMSLLAIPVALVCILFLPESAGRSLEDLSKHTVE